ncbi:hypothetical protein IFT48_02505 [Pseudomonas fluorescens]|uniref:hypothetical protein n=1 Tax=Pseudomonas fluorescens TaxID=294 RepID=UPI001930A16F|nr:hypothetical protein [Pseudomonas fluorescens]MBD8088836.1 hypothetical protein [Pseudomonas fluorescens]
MDEVMVKTPRVSNAGYLAFMGISAIVCGLVAGHAALDALVLLNDAVSSKLLDKTKSCEGALMLVAAGIFGCIGATSLKDLVQALRQPPQV